MKEVRVTFPPESRAQAERNRMALGAIVVDRRYTDPPGGKLSIAGPMDARQIAVIEHALGEVAVPLAGALDLINLVGRDGKPLPTYAELEARVAELETALARAGILAVK